MGIQKDIETTTGALARYHRISALRIDWKQKQLAGVIASYYTQEARDAGKGTLGTNEFTMVGDQFPLQPEGLEGLEAIKAVLGVPADHQLLNVQFSFDGGAAFYRTTEQRMVQGLPVQLEVQGAVLKEQLPTDYLAVVYPIIAGNAPFTDSEQV